MQFTAITVENMFAYGGEPARIDLSKCTPERNLVVVTGANGAGKTSLLNALKLLFLGPNNDELLRVGLAGTPLRPKQYVAGVPGRWFGVFNTSAEPGATAQVTLEWREDDQAFSARRWFRRQRGTSDFEQGIEVESANVSLSGDDAEMRLQQLLPREVVRFFFFDGEQIQAIADAEVGREQAEIERLLGLSFVVEVLQQLDEYQRDRGRAGIPEDVRKRMIAAENAAREEEAGADAARRSREALDEELLDLDRERRRLTDEARRLRGGTLSESERVRILSRLAVLESQRETLAERIADTIVPESAFLTQPDLVARGFEILDQQVSSSADPLLAEKISKDLPRYVSEVMKELSPPVFLSDKQRSDLAPLITNRLEELGLSQGSGRHELLQSLSPRDAADLRDRFLVWHEKGSLLAGDHRAMLVEMRQISSEMQKLRRELDEAELTSDETKARYEELLSRIDITEKRARATIEAAAEKRIEEQQALQDAAMHRDAVLSLEREFQHVAEQNSRYRLALRTIRALDDYRSERRATIRASVEKRLNERVGILLAPTKLVKSVRLDDQFGMRYFDAFGEEVARHSISAGMRQLLAMAMLWALKDEAQKPLPVVVDTPLGRIDGQNRQLLLSQYFPAAGNPLVLLPTDTELSEEGLETLRPHIAARYRIENKDGMRATLVPERIDAPVRPL